MNGTKFFTPWPKTTTNTLGTIKNTLRRLQNTWKRPWNTIRNNPKCFQKLTPTKPLKSLQKHLSKPPKTLSLAFLFSFLTLPEIIWLFLKNLHSLFPKTARVTKIHFFTFGLPLSLFHTFCQSFSIYLSTFWPMFFHWMWEKPFSFSF